jgi:catechol 2,3-dioxygenase-like lactoylglutathione lyase family enzyme
MKVSAYHHTALRVSDIDRSSRFYVEALGGRLQTSKMIYDGPDAEVIMGGTPNARFKVCLIGFDEGTVELFEFLEPVHPVAPPPPAEGAIIHTCFTVDNVPTALERVEAAGGKRYWPEVRDMPGDFQVVYVTDPDGHVLELIDIDARELVKRLIEADPNNAPTV